MARGGFPVPEETSCSMLCQTLVYLVGVTKAVVSSSHPWKSSKHSHSPHRRRWGWPRWTCQWTYITTHLSLRSWPHLSRITPPPVRKNKVEGLKLVLESADSDVQKCMLCHWRELAP